MAVIDIWEVNNNRESLRKMWEIEPISNHPVKEFVYGNAPEGYIETMVAIPLEIGKTYTIHGRYFFQFIRKEKGIDVNVFQD